MDAKFVQGECLRVDYTPAAAVVAGQIVSHLGMACVADAAIEAGRMGALAMPVDGQAIYRVTKAASIVLLSGLQVYWDPASSTASFKRLSAQAFLIGTVAEDAASSDTTVLVRFNGRTRYVVDALNDPCDSVIVKTAGTPQLRTIGGCVSLEFSATAEVQKVDLLSKDGFDPDDGVIVEFAVEVVTNGDAAAVDFNIGVANGTHASDGDAITESCFLHIDGASANINAESDDGTTEVASTDTTVDFTAGTRFVGWLDIRDPSDIQVYIDGVNVLSGSTFKLDAATGPLKLLAHLEKTADDSPGEYHIDRLRAFATK